MNSLGILEWEEYKVCKELRDRIANEQFMGKEFAENIQLGMDNGDIGEIISKLLDYAVEYTSIDNPFKNEDTVTYLCEVTNRLMDFKR